VGSTRSDLFPWMKPSARSSTFTLQLPNPFKWQKGPGSITGCGCSAFPSRGEQGFPCGTLPAGLWMSRFKVLTGCGFIVTVSMKKAG